VGISPPLSPCRSERGEPRKGHRLPHRQREFGEFRRLLCESAIQQRCPVRAENPPPGELFWRSAQRMRNRGLGGGAGWIQTPGTIEDLKRKIVGGSGPLFGLLNTIGGDGDFLRHSFGSITESAVLEEDERQIQDLKRHPFKASRREVSEFTARRTSFVRAAEPCVCRNLRRRLKLRRPKEHTNGNQSRDGSYSLG
jgi:hypothetical protein